MVGSKRNLEQQWLWSEIEFGVSWCRKREKHPHPPPNLIIFIYNFDMVAV